MKEKTLNPSSGWMMLIVILILSGIAPILVYFGIYAAAPIIGTLVLFLLMGFASIEPNSYRVCTLFGDYKGTIKKEGLIWVNPLYKKVKISARANSLQTEPLKVNDKEGNPILIGAVVVWKVDDTYKASFEVQNYHAFVHTQSEAAIRKLAALYSYDHFEDEDAEVTLRGNSEEVNHILESEISERLMMAGITIIEARIAHLAYASEIAGAMLQRQQAAAVVAARTLIVEGAVGMVELALDKINKRELAALTQDQKAQMVSNLLVVLCSEKSASPVINAG